MRTWRTFVALLAALAASLSLTGASAPALAAGPPLHLTAEPSAVFDRSAGLARLALAWDDDGANPEVEQLLIDGGLAVAAVRGHHPRRPSGPLDDPVDGRGELRRVRGVAQLDVVVQHDPSSLSANWAL